VTSIKPDTQLLQLPPLWPEAPTADHYRTVLTRSALGHALLNSGVVATVTVLAAIVLGGLCAFALARLPVPGKGAILGVVLACSMFPPIAVISPVYMLVRALGLRDTLSALILTHTASTLPLAIWILASFFRQLPADLYRAALVDGCSPWRALWSVMAPPALPGVVVASLLVFIFSWNEFMFALTLTASVQARTAPVELALFPGLHEVPWGDMAAATLLVMAPVMLLAVLFQRHLVAGLTAGSIKG
jgi:multiple sugar transport system permease protein